MKFGVDYYPEHWPKERWTYDSKLMKEAGIECVRLAEFAWAKLETEFEKFNFEWLDEAIEILGKDGIKSILGTPTPAPPAWLIEKHPDILPVDINGIYRGFGGRHHDCQSNENYRNHIIRFLTIMAKHYSSNPNVVGWQIDNEFGNSHQDLCTCDSCKNAFHRWLENKYTTIGKLNEEWGTVFWSQTYNSFNQIPAPLPTPNSHNPALLLDWKRSTSDLIVEFQKIQVDILRRECSSHFITHNFMGFFDKTNYFNLAKDLDFVSHDQYPLHFKNGRDLTPSPMRAAAALDLMRGMKQKPFWIMEQQAGASGWEVIGATPRPGQLRLWTYQSIAHGADTVLYFRWRSCLFGTEEYWHGILPHSGEPGRRYDEIKKGIEDIAPIMDEFAGCTAEAEVGIIFNYDQEWALQIQPHHPDLNYVKHVQGYYKAFHDANIPVNFLSEEEDFSKYKLIIAPLMFLMTPEFEEKFEKYVLGGGHLVLTMRTGVKDWNNAVVPKTLPGDIHPVLGIKIYDYDCLREVKQEICWTTGTNDTVEEVSKWCDIITLDGAETLATYRREFYGGTPAITANSYKNGIGYYVGTELGPNMIKQFIEYAVEKAGVKAIMDTPMGIEAIRRRNEDTDYVFILNHNSETVGFNIKPGWNARIGQKFVNGDRLDLPAYEVALFMVDIEIEYIDLSDSETRKKVGFK